jgi:hypothetical protein
MGTAYAVWGGIGALGTVLVGIIWFDEPAATVRIMLIFALIACIAGLRITPERCYRAGLKCRATSGVFLDRPEEARIEPLL